MSADPRDVISNVLPKSWSQAKKDDLINKITDALYEECLLVEDAINVVEVLGAMVTVETVEAYGLTIEVDANGDAVQVVSPHGLVVVG